MSDKDPYITEALRRQRNTGPLMNYADTGDIDRAIALFRRQFYDQLPTTIVLPSKRFSFATNQLTLFRGTPVTFSDSLSPDYFELVEPNDAQTRILHAFTAPPTAAKETTTE